MREDTHYCYDPQYPERALTFRAYKCLACGKLHRAEATEPQVMPWILAHWRRNLTQISDIPPTAAEAHAILDEQSAKGVVADEGTQASNTQDNHEGIS